MKQILYLLTILLFCACEEDIKLDLPLQDQRLVVDGLITNQFRQYSVTLSYSTKYDYQYDLSNQLMVQDATVILRDNEGSIDTLIEYRNGVYLSDTNHIIGHIGRSYWIEIQTAEGQTWLSEPEKMLPVPKIDALTFERDEDDVSEEDSRHYKFTIYVDWKDSLNFDNYYLRNVEYYWGNSWKTDIAWNWVFDDKYIDGKTMSKNFLTSDYGGAPFYVRLNQYSLTAKAFQFWNLVHEQTQGADNNLVNSGVPLYGNVYNAASPDERSLGYFQVSAHDDEIVHINR